MATVYSEISTSLINRTKLIIIMLYLLGNSSVVFRRLWLLAGGLQPSAGLREHRVSKGVRLKWCVTLRD